MALETRGSNSPEQGVMGRHIPYGWIILGFFLTPLLCLLVWANYQLLGLGLEAIFGLNRIEWPILGSVVSIQDVIATATIAGEILAGFLFAELAGWINLLDFDHHLESGQRRFLKWVSLALFFSLVVAEVGIALYRQNVIDKQSQEYSERLRDLSTQTSSQPAVDKSGQVDLTKDSRDRITKPSSTHKDPTIKKASATSDGWASLLDSLPLVATVSIHVAIPFLTAAIGVIMSPLTFFVCGLGFTLAGPIPLRLLCILFDLLARMLKAFRSIAIALLHLIAAPTRILIEGVVHWRSDS